MEKKKIDIKLIFIFILGGALILMFIFKGGKPIDGYETEINYLKANNLFLKTQNDSLKVEANKIDDKIDSINKKIDLNSIQLKVAQNKIIFLENKKNEIPTYVNHLNANGVSSELSKYIKRRKR